MSANPILAVIGGSGVYSLEGLSNTDVVSIKTPFGDVDITLGVFQGRQLAFLCRHGSGHKLPPHKINYRANLWALHLLGVKQVIAINAVGGIGKDCAPGTIIIPDQIIDYSYGREHTFAEQITEQFNHVEFARPYSVVLRSQLVAAAHEAHEAIVDGGCYACTQGPRLESAAEIQRLMRDGNTIVGMTAMPEAALARELSVEYASLCIVANWAAGLDDTPITMEDILAVLKASIARAQCILAAHVGNLGA
ncbi:MAG: S-methyl-5'-thioinosine phosphorylase [Marinagarivorans sp.]|nr:S-methyl-5'-thioinosine phosphorylase [Marinagarivorans sp.]